MDFGCACGGIPHGRCGALEQHVPHPSELSKLAVAVHCLASTSRCLVLVMGVSKIDGFCWGKSHLEIDDN